MKCNLENHAKLHINPFHVTELHLHDTRFLKHSFNFVFDLSIHMCERGRIRKWTKQVYTAEILLQE